MHLTENFFFFIFSRMEENPKKPTAGHILTKSASFHASPDIKMDVGFEASDVRPILSMRIQ